MYKQFLLVSMLLLIIGTVFALPVTTFESFQVPNTTDQNITLTCTDNNTGCKTINWNIANNQWIQIINLLTLKDNDLNNTNYVEEFTNATDSFVLEKTYNFIKIIDVNNYPLNISATMRLDAPKHPSYNAQARFKLYFNDGTTEYTSTESTPVNNYEWHNKNFTITTKNKDLNKIELELKSAYIGYTARLKNVTISYDKNTYYYLENPLSFLYSGIGDHNIQYFSTDNADNNETIKTSTFTTYGLANFTFYDEDTEALLNDVTYTISPSINGVSGGTLTDINVLDLNLQGITSQEYTFTFTKTGYGTRYYTTNLNQFSDININFALLPTTLSTDIPLKVYQTDETTIFLNTFVEMYLPDTNWSVGKRKTNTNGETTFSLHTSDQNYYANVNNGAFTYQPVALTILYPKNEETLTQIDENWQIDITQNLYVSYTELNADKIIYLLPNTANAFNIKISDMNGNYFARTYAKQYPGNPLTDTLQPYLVSTTTGLLTTITTKDAYTNTIIGGITIKIYKFISGEGRTLVEQVVTDDKGQALVLLILNGEYEFECYQDAEFLKTYTISATSSTIWLLLPIGTSTIPTIDPSGFKTSFTPTNTGLAQQNVGNQVFTQTLANYGGLTYTYTSIITQNGTTLGTTTGSSSDTSKTFTHTIAWTDMNSGTITSKLTIIVGGETFVFQQDYIINDMFGTNVDLLSVLSTGLRSDATCSATGVCFPLLVVGLILSMAIAIMASMMMGNLSGQTAGFLFLIPMILFTYLTWIPFELTVGLVLVLLAFLINERRQ